MIHFIKKLFADKPSIDYTDLLKNGATILDVRSKAEYQSGHIKDSLNIPLDQLPANLHKLKKDRSIIVCCASGVRSSHGKSILISHGFKEIHNGGGWRNLQHKIKQHSL